ncbi:MAG: hypothetical protein WKF45_11210 [Ilumatobacteraceae bacterium]
MEYRRTDLVAEVLGGTKRTSSPRWRCSSTTACSSATRRAEWAR